MEKRDNPKKNQKRLAALFIGLFLLFFIIRFPFREVKIWAISSAAALAEINISFGDSSLLLPLGLELEDFVIVQKRGVFVTPQIEALSVRINPLSLMGGRKELSFYLTNGGNGSGSIALEGDRAIINVDSKRIRIDGLKLERQAFVERGNINMNGDLVLSRDYRKGEGALHMEGSDLVLKNMSPFVPVIPLKDFSAHVEKKDAYVNIKSLSLHSEGVRFKGSGTVQLARPVERSTLDLSGKVDLSNISGSPLSGILSMIRGVTGGKDTFTLRLAGNFASPRVSVDGKKLF